MEIIIIAAVAENNAIGKSGDIPWRIKEDFRHFQKMTMGWPCIMGDKTFDSLPKGSRPLPGRENIVLSLDMNYIAEGAKVFHSWDDAVSYCRKNAKNEKAYICGGAGIYRLAMEKADRLEITRIKKSFDADTFFPEIDMSKWEIEKKEDCEGTDSRTGGKLGMSFIAYRRKK